MAGGSTGRKVSYPYFKAFNQMLGNLDLFRQLFQTSSEATSNHGQLTQGTYINKAIIIILL